MTTTPTNATRAKSLLAEKNAVLAAEVPYRQAVQSAMEKCNKVARRKPSDVADAQLRFNKAVDDLVKYCRATPQGNRQI